jgi:RNA polymerase sigma-70 factor (ECF subfamily)
LNDFPIAIVYNVNESFHIYGGVLLKDFEYFKGNEGLTEEELLKASLRGDKKAFEQIVAIHQKDLYFTALGIVRSGWDALDVCQETFLKAFTSLGTLKDPASLKAWLSKILINSCNDLFRLRKRVIVSDQTELTGFFDEPAEESLDLLRALSALSTEHRVVITLRYFQDLSVKDIAIIAGCPEGTVKSRISYALKEMRKLMAATCEDRQPAKEDAK